jgi:hypothetical protein
MAENVMWGADCPVSSPVVRPDATDGSIKVPLGGLAITPIGVVFDLDQATFEEIYLPRFAPEGMP